MFPSRTPDVRECNIYDRIKQFPSETTEVTQKSPGGHSGYWTGVRETSRQLSELAILSSFSFSLHHSQHRHWSYTESTLGSKDQYISTVVDYVLPYRWDLYFQYEYKSLCTTDTWLLRCSHCILCWTPCCWASWELGRCWVWTHSTGRPSSRKSLLGSHHLSASVSSFHRSSNSRVSV